MLEHFNALEEYAYSVTSECDNRPDMLLQSELELIRDIIPIMKSAKDVIAEMCGENLPTASVMIPLVKSKRSHSSN